MAHLSTSLTLRALFRTAIDRANLDTRAPAVTGLSPAAAALFLAARASRQTTLAIVPTDRDVERMTADARYFLAALAGLSEREVERAALPFPSREVDPYRDLAPHLDVSSARARALHSLARGTARLVIASARSMLPRLSAPSRLLKASIEIALNDELSPVALGELLADAGFTREDPVDEHGEYCVRGGVVDVFPAGDAEPIRFEFVGDTVESIRRYDATTQRSTAHQDRAVLVPVRDQFEETPRGALAEADGGGEPAGETDVDRSATIFDYARAAGTPAVVLLEEETVRAQIARFLEQLETSHAQAAASRPQAPPPSAITLATDDVEQHLAGATRLDELRIGLEGENPAAEPPAGAHVACQPALEFAGRVGDWIAEVRRARERGDTVLFVAASVGRADRIVELLAEYDLLALQIDRAEDTHAAAVLVGIGRLSRGFRLPAAALQLYAETDVFEEERKAYERRRSVARTFLSDFRDLKANDLVVHVDHGIGRFAGLKRLTVGLETQEFMELRYAGEDKLFVPVERLDLVQKYSGASSAALDRLGGATWERAKTRVRRAMRDMAEELLKLYAARKAVPGHAFSPDSHWQQEFEDAFEFELTPDQEAAIRDIKRDMEAPTPMDRLLCGDVGYGKTEVAMRAAFKAVMDGKQVAFLAPTTVLAFQHVKTLRDRFAAFPVRIDMISRFRSNIEQKGVIADLEAGRIEIVVGTHRLLSKDVRFRDLGLLVVDEEQRFGVAHKERIKQLRRRVDVLTMTATPIPRTLNMSLVGIRDISVIETPPRDRLSIQTHVVKFDQQIITRALRHEIERGGQIYFVHNRVESIVSMGNLLTRLVPEARIAIAHGQMNDDSLERTMVDFVSHAYDVLLATTIIENGLDIPNANTMVINRADRYGLAQLYQLRGRVGRSDRRAYAYLLIPPEDSLSPVARKRLAAIKEFSDLGSGFRVAALDLEIRGAGNLLGGEQSGHIEAIGFEMYMKLLEQTVRELKGEEIEDERRATVNLHVDLRIDEEYVPDMNQRLTLYRRIAAARHEVELERVLEEIRDRYGPMPPSVMNLAAYGRIRILADQLGLEAIDREGTAVVFRFREEARADAGVMVRLVQTRTDLTLHPPNLLRLDLRRDSPRAPAPRPAAARRPLVQPPGSTSSWWTTRATAGEVTPGFSKAEVLRPAAEDPRSVTGVLTRVADLLAELRPSLGIG